MKSHGRMNQFYHVVLSLFSLIANSNHFYQSKRFSLLSHLALSSQNKFFLKSPPKSRKKMEAGQVAGSPDADVVSEPDDEADSIEGLSPTCQYENCPSAGLDYAICDLVSLDSQAEVDQGIFQREGKSQRGFRSFLPATLHYPKTLILFFLPLYSFPIKFTRIQVQSLPPGRSHV